MLSLHIKVLLQTKSDLLKLLECCASLDEAYKSAICVNTTLFIFPYVFTKYSANCHEDITHFSSIWYFAKQKN